MNGDRVDRVDAIFQGALERPLAERAAFVEAACAGDPGLRRAVDRLLGSHERARAEGFLEEPAALAPASAAAEEEGPAAGELVGRYRIVDRIGLGGMGAVFLALDENLGRRVAVKVLKGGPGHGEERARRLRREALAASALNHPNIITIHEVGAWNGRAFMATEFIEGVTLRRLMEGDRLTPAQALDIGVQIAGALSAAHAAGVVHRDVKPDNVMIRPDGLVKVLDFGIAKYGEAAGPAVTGEGLVETRPGAVVGTFAYMSPEQARGLETDARTDVWALGCVVFEMMAGRAAFARASASATVAAVLEGEPDWTALPETTPPLLRRMMQRCLAKDVGQRLEDMDRARATLDGAQERMVGRAGGRRASGLDQLARRRLDEIRSSELRTETDASTFGRAVERPGRRGGRLALGVAAAAVCVLVALAMTGRFRDRAEGTRGAGRTDALHLAVLPIVAPPGDGELQLVALAVLDLLTQRLAGTAGLRVRNPEFLPPSAPPAGVVRERPRDAAEGAYAIAGDLRRSESGDRGRLRLQLVEPSAGREPRRTPLGEYEIPFLQSAPDLAAFAAAREAIVGQVLHLLLPALPLASSSVASPRDPEAYRLYLTALPHLRQVTCVGPVALDSLRRSVELDPRFAPAWEELGWARYGLVSSCGESADNYRLAAEAADRALRLAPFRPRATCLKAAVLVESGRAEEAYALLDAAHQRMPDDLDLVFARAYVLTYAGFLDEAVSLVETAAAADPTRSSTLAWSTNAYLHRGDVERFLALQLRSDSPLFRYYRGYAHVLEGRADEARRVLAPAFREHPSDVFARLAQALLEIVEGRPEAARLLVRQVVLQRRTVGGVDGEVTYKVALLLARAGAREEAEAQLRQAVDQGFFCPRCLEKEPSLAPLRTRPAYAESAARARERHVRFAQRFRLAAE